MAKRAGIIRQSSDAGEDNSSKREADNQDVALNTGYERVMKRQAAKQATARRPDYDSADPTCDGQPAECHEERNGFWSFFLPSVQGNIHAASESLQRGGRDDNRWAAANLDAASKRLQEAKEDTLNRIKERDQRTESKDSEADSMRRFLFGSIWDEK